MLPGEREEGVSHDTGLGDRQSSCILDGRFAEELLGISYLSTEPSVTTQSCPVE